MSQEEKLKDAISRFNMWMMYIRDNIPSIYIFEKKLKNQ